MFSYSYQKQDFDFVKMYMYYKSICCFFFLNFVSVKIETELVEEKEKYEYKLCRRKLIVEGK